METFLYNTITQQREGPIRQGPYLVDGKPGVLPDGWVELTIQQLPSPNYDNQTETLEYRQYPDLINNLWIQEAFVRQLNQDEINQRIPQAISCTPRQFRLALIELNISIVTIENMLNSIQDESERKKAWVEWEYSIEIKKDHPLIISFANQLNISEQQLNEIFLLAITFI